MVGCTARVRTLTLAVAFWTMLSPVPSHADQPPPSEPSEDDAVVRARKHFEDGITFVREHEWGRALEAFESSAALRPHAVTTYNIGACHRAMGRYTRAKAALQDALARHESGESLPPNLIEDSNRFLGEIDRLLAHVKLRVSPADARVAVDGAPLKLISKPGGPPLLVAGVRGAGPGERLPAKTVELVLDPGAHVFLLSRKGFSDVALNRTFPADSRSELAYQLDKLPAQLKITANVERAMVEIGGRPVGMTPLSLQQPAGTYAVTVVSEGHEPYETQVSVKPGEAVTLKATLPEATPSIVERWWFWTIAGVVVTGAVVGTYFGTRPEPERPPLDGGGLGWTVPLE